MSAPTVGQTRDPRYRQPVTDPGLELDKGVCAALMRAGINAIGDLMDWVQNPVRPKIATIGNGKLMRICTQLEKYLGLRVGTIVPNRSGY